MNALALPVIHPGFQTLKRNGRLLHLTAAGLLVTHAVTHLLQQNPSILYIGCLLLIAIDIFILVFAVRNALGEMPRVNLFFRVIEVLFFIAIGAELIFRSQWLMGSFHLLLGIVYIYLFHCERTASREERVAIHHTGITIPALPESRFFLWSQIQYIEATYSCITVHTSLDKTYTFDLQHNLEFEELDQIHEFCRHYLGASR
jgi:hypothetical protein